MEQGRERAATDAVSRAAHAAADAAADRDRKATEEQGREAAARRLSETKRVLTDDQNAASRDGHLDTTRVKEIRKLQSEGGDKAVAKRLGEAAVNSPEAAKAKAQRASIRRHERDLIERANEPVFTPEREPAPTTRQAKSQTPLRDKAIQLQRERERDRQNRSRDSLGR